MDKFAQLVGRQYHLFDYVGAPDAERVIVTMGSGAEVAQENRRVLERNNLGSKVGCSRFISIARFRWNILCSTARLGQDDCGARPHERTWEGGEPLYLDVVNALVEGVGAGLVPALPRIIGGRYGLGSKDFTPAMVKGVFDEMSKAKPKNHFTIGILDDVTNTSLD